MIDSKDRDYRSKVWCDGFAHCREVGGYWNHWKFGGIATLWMMLAIPMSIIHLIIPHLFPSVADNIAVYIGARSMKPRGWRLQEHHFTKIAPIPDWVAIKNPNSK